MSVNEVRKIPCHDVRHISTHSVPGTWGLFRSMAPSPSPLLVDVSFETLLPFTLTPCFARSSWLAPQIPREECTLKYSHWFSTQPFKGLSIKCRSRLSEVPWLKRSTNNYFDGTGLGSTRFRQPKTSSRPSTSRSFWVSDLPWRDTVRSNFRSLSCLRSLSYVPGRFFRGRQDERQDSTINSHLYTKPLVYSPPIVTITWHFELWWEIGVLKVGLPSVSPQISLVIAFLVGSLCFLRPFPINIFIYPSHVST